MCIRDSQGSDSTRVASLTVTNIDKTQPTVTFGTNGSTSYKTVSYTHLLKKWKREEMQRYFRLPMWVK